MCNPICFVHLGLCSSKGWAVFLHHPMQKRLQYLQDFINFHNSTHSETLRFFCNIHNNHRGKGEKKEGKREKRERGKREEREREKERSMCYWRKGSYLKGTRRWKSFYKINIVHSTFGLLSFNSALFKKCNFFQGSRMPYAQPGTHILHLLFPLLHP